MPPSGYIWEEDGRLVGNLSLIPINVQNKRGYMIANVATHPDYRGRGIARALTTTALEYARSRNAACVWLQVRDDNPSAIHIYETTGFKERLRRTGWFSGPDPQDNPTPAGVRVTKRRSVHWQAQRDWLKRSYPPELAWHIPFDWNLMRPDMWGMLYRFLIFEYPHHWVVERGGQLKGVLTWRHTSGYTDPLWLAVPDEVDEGAILALVGQARRYIRQIQPLSLNYPAGVMVDVLRQAGFYPHQTLIWMEFIFPG
jgi:ribosomal protein S18 acetylase RimI-like enzyme